VVRSNRVFELVRKIRPWGGCKDNLEVKSSKKFR